MTSAVSPLASTNPRADQPTLDYEGDAAEDAIVLSDEDIIEVVSPPSR